jgi:organic hydroperoxide reductase OsmC/OhrA
MECAELDWEPVKYRYATSLRWTGEHKGDLSCEGKPDIKVACPPEWGGHAGIWSPEDLFVASIEVCTLTTFLSLLEKLRGDLISYESEAEGTAQMVDCVFIFKEIVVRAKVKVPTKEDAELAARAFDGLGDMCLITKSVKCKIRVEPQITVV